MVEEDIITKATREKGQPPFYAAPTTRFLLASSSEETLVTNFFHKLGCLRPPSPAQGCTCI